MSGLESYINLLQSALKTKFEALILSQLQAFIPIPFLNPILRKFAEIIAKKIAEDAEMRAFFIHTDLRSSKQGREFLASLEKNKNVLLNPNNSEEHKNAEKEVIDNFRNLIKFSY